MSVPANRKKSQRGVFLIITAVMAIVLTNFPYTVLSPYISGTFYGPDVVAALPLGANCQ